MSVTPGKAIERLWLTGAMIVYSKLFVDLDAPSTAFLSLRTSIVAGSSHQR